MSAPRPLVTIVGAGPTGLTLAVELSAARIPFRLIDSAATPVHESRALAIQARTLEVLQRDGIAAQLVAGGDPARVIELHGSRDVDLKLFGESETQTDFPFLLFLSQARTEEILLAHLQRRGVTVERDTRLIGLSQTADHVAIDVETPSGRQSATTDYVVGCDGAHSAVRQLAGIDFDGSGFPQTFAIADLEVDGLQRDRVHSYVASTGLMFFFPLGDPTTWRLLAMLPEDPVADKLNLTTLQRVVDHYVGKGKLILRDPAWVTTFHVQSRHARHLRDRRVLLAGDAAHIHSPAGAQGMNTGIQDAVNLGWKLAQVLDGDARVGLLDTFEGERLPVARSVLRMTDRLFRMATTSNPLVRFARPRLAPIAIGLAARSRALRRIGFRIVSQVAISYRRGELAASSRSVRLGRLRAGDRLPPFPVMIEGASVDLRTRLSTPRYLLAAIGAHQADVAEIDGPVEMVHCEWPPETAKGRSTSWLLVRPDGYIAGIWRTRRGVQEFLNAWSD